MQLFKINLRLFDEGAATAGTAQVADGQQSDNVEAFEDTTLVDDEGGTQVQNANAQESQEVVETFEDLIKGKYKEDFDKRVKSIIDRRLKGHNDLKASLDRTQPILDILSAKYDVESGDIDAILNALNEDNSFYEEAASELGISVDGYKHLIAQQSENKRLRTALEQAEQQRAFDMKWDNWMSQVEEVEKIYPDFDFETEISNNQFMQLIDNGVNVRAAYEACHAQEILQGAMAYTARQVQKQTADNIAARGARPTEGGIAGQPSVTQKIDVSKLTREEMKKLAMRAARGEVITLT